MWIDDVGVVDIEDAHEREAVEIGDDPGSLVGVLVVMQ
jgi:hypothetical protein